MGRSADMLGPMQRSLIMAAPLTLAVPIVIGLGAIRPDPGLEGCRLRA
jgi:hypothetical protein